MIISILFFIICIAFSLYYLNSKQLLQTTKTKIVVTLLIIIAFVIRGFCLSHISWDYITFLSDWINYYRTHNGFEALTDTVGNYNIPYLTFLAAISYFKIDSLIPIKLLSIFFDVLLAVGATQIVSLCTKEKNTQLAIFISVLLLPTVVINGSFWGQCDSIYTALAVLSFYFALSRKPWLSIILLACSFSFKLQAVFIFPIFLLLWACGYFKWYHFIAFPVTYFVTVLPAIIAGKPIMDSLLVYIYQVESSAGNKYSANGPSLLLIVQSAPTILAFLNTDEAVDLVCKIATVSAFVVVAIILIIQYIRRDSLDIKDLICTATIFVLIIPYLLPHMHERYFFIADVLTLVLAYIDIKYLPSFIFTEGASLWCYWSLYTFDADTYLGVCGSFAITIALFWLIIVYVVQSVKKSKLIDLSKS